ncbi:MAG: GNAT family N-acetyltransferase [Chitinophagales bacterium]|nr:GNAT family N-acetyltransferase [Chitinophagales bacterium]
MIEIRQLNKNALQAYIDDPEYHQSTHVAIAKHRAVSHIHNPRAKSEDILLFLAFEGNQMVGYLGALPDDLFLANGLQYHFAWMSCLWIDPEQRGKSIAKKLLASCFLAWNNRIILTEYTGPAGNLYQKSGLFDILPELQGRRWYIQADLSRILPPKKRIFQQLLPLLKLSDWAVNAVLQMTKRCAQPIIELTEVTDFNPVLTLFIEQKMKVVGFRQNVEIIRWMSEYPWITESSPTVESSRYYFSSVAQQFVCKSYTICDKNGEIIAFFLITIRDGHLKMPVIYHDAAAQNVVLALQWLIQEFKVKTMTLYDAEIIEYILKHNKIKSFSKAMSRNYMIGCTFWEEIGHFEIPLHAGDGDTAFT